MAQTPITAPQLRSTLTEDGYIELSISEAPIPTPGVGQVLVEVGGAPINPTDIALLFGPADVSRAELVERAGQPVVRIPCLPEALGRYAARVDKTLPVGIEGAGTVIAVGEGAEALLGRTVAAMGGAMYSKYIVLDASQCLVMPEGVTPRDAASSLVNPLTALAMVETAHLEGHKAIIHTAAASNLGVMLHRICKADGIPLINIVRRPEQAAFLRAEGAEFICDSSESDFHQKLLAAISATRATIVFDAIGGGGLVGEILHDMEVALQPKEGAYNMYGGAGYKQAYVYGALDSGPTQFSRTFGMSWGIAGWLLTPVMEKFGPAVAERLRQRVASEIKTTFASRYTAELSLIEVLQPSVLAAAYRRATGEKYLVNPSKS